MNVFRGVAVFALFAALAYPPGSSFAGQSGRQTETKPGQKVKPVPPPPLPIPKPAEVPDEAETIKISSDLVMVVTTVTTPDKSEVPSLKQEDFEIIEDGIPQDIVHFAYDPDVPLRMILLFDTSLSILSRLEFERRAAARFLERVMRPKDETALFSFGTDVTLIQGFTSSVPTLVNGMRQLKAKGATSLYDALYLAADYVKPTEGRHVLVVASDGGDTTSRKDLKAALAQAQLADAVIYAIWTGSIWPSENLRDLAAERALAALTMETGGEVFYPKPMSGPDDRESDEKTLAELNDTFGRLALRIRTQYTIGFYSKNDARDGSFRKVKVRVKRPGLTALARSGYFATKD